MGKLIVSAQMTVDAVMDQVEDWFAPALDDVGHGIEQLRAADALLLGRETYEALSEYWPTASGAYADLVNPIPKFVASRTLTGPLTWNARLLGPDVVQEVATLKERHEGTLLSYGCGELAGHLARNGLVDEVRLWLHPVVLGDGVRPFHAGRLPVRMRLIAATPYASGLVQLSYRPLADDT